LANWLYGVAQRVAHKARAVAAKRRAHESPSNDTELDLASGPAPGREPYWLPALDEELSRLPDKYRAPLVLCYLEGKSNAEAARLLQCEVGALKTHLTRGRRLLHGRLTSRGLTLSAAALGSALAQQATALGQVPIRLGSSTMQAALAATGAGGAAQVLAAAALVEMGRARAFRWAAVLLTACSIGIKTLKTLPRSPSWRWPATPSGFSSP
jgi:hypothetical protein